MKKNHRATRPLRLALSLAGAAALCVHVADAQNLEEIVVSASKRGDTAIQDTPISVQQIGGDTLQENGSLDFNDYYRQVPGLSVSDQGPGDKRIIIRGVNSGGAGTVGLYFDEIIVTGENIVGDGGRQPDIKLFDMDRIEILRGPQGTTFGSSSLSGTIRWLPNSPDLNSYDASVGLKVSQLAHSSSTGWQTDGMVNLPLVPGKLGLRLSGMQVDGAGYIDDRFEKDANGEETQAVRGMLTWQIADGLDLSALAMYQDFRIDARPYYNLQDLDLPASPSLNGGPLPTRFYANSQSRGGFTDRIDMYNLKLNYEREWGTFTATTSVFNRYAQIRKSVSAATEVLSGGALPADGAGRSIIENNKDQRVQSSEARFSSDWNGPVQVLFGGFYQSEDRDFQSRYPTVDATTGRAHAGSRILLDRLDFNQQDELAFFGEADWAVTDRLTLTTGARWFEFDLEQYAVRVVDFLARPGAGRGGTFESSESGTIFKGNLSYALNDDMMVFVQVAEGFRAGGVNDQTAASIAGVTIPAGFQSDSLINYELGLKSAWLDGRLILNGSVFLIDWDDIQVRRFAESVEGLQFAYRGNGGKAEVKGVELELASYLMDGLEIGLTGSYTQAELKESFPVAGEGLAGDAIPHVPDFTVSLNARYERQLGNDASGFVGGDWSYVDKSGSLFRPTNRFYRESASHSILNLRTGVAYGDWSVVLSVNNVFDTDDTLFYVFDYQGPPPAGGNIPDDLVRPWPREISLSVTKSFF